MQEATETSDLEHTPAPVPPPEYGGLLSPRPTGDFEAETALFDFPDAAEGDSSEDVKSEGVVDSGRGGYRYYPSRFDLADLVQKLPAVTTPEELIQGVKLLEAFLAQEPDTN